jgi:hypothetical protein
MSLRVFPQNALCSELAPRCGKVAVHTSARHTGFRAQRNPQGKYPGVWQLRRFPQIHSAFLRSKISLSLVKDS